MTKVEHIGAFALEISSEHRFGEDALLLAQFTTPRADETVCDLGTGCGILPLWWCSRCPPAHITAVELQPEAAAMARRSVERAGLQPRVTVLRADLRQWAEWAVPASMDVVTMNPPYFAVGSGGISRSDSTRIARHEGAGCTLPEVTQATVGLLKPGGRFCLCHRPERQADVLMTLSAAGLQPCRLRFVQRNAASAPWLLLCEAVKDGAAGLMRLPPLLREHPDGTLTEEYNRLYNVDNYE